MHRLGIIGLCAFLVGGCSEPAYTKLNPVHGERVGVVLAVSPELTNVHLGVTIFGEFSGKLSNEWRLDAEALNFTVAQLKSSGYEVTQIPLSEVGAKDIQGEEDWAHDNQNGLTDKGRDRYARIMEQDHLRALVILRERLIYPRGYDHPAYHGIGIVSQFNNAPEMFVSVIADVIGDIPPHRAVSICFAAEKFDRAMVRVEDLKDLDAERLEPLHAEIRSLLERKIRFDLIDSGLISGSATCPGHSPTTTPATYVKE